MGMREGEGRVGTRGWGRACLDWPFLDCENFNFCIGTSATAITTMHPYLTLAMASPSGWPWPE